MAEGEQDLLMGAYSRSTSAADQVGQMPAGAQNITMKLYP